MTIHIDPPAPLTDLTPLMAAGLTALASIGPLLRYRSGYGDSRGLIITDVTAMALIRRGLVVTQIYGKRLALTPRGRWRAETLLALEAATERVLNAQ